MLLKQVDLVTINKTSKVLMRDKLYQFSTLSLRFPSLTVLCLYCSLYQIYLWANSIFASSKRQPTWHKFYFPFSFLPTNYFTAKKEYKMYKKMK